MSIISVRELSKKYKLGVFSAKSLREEAESFFASWRRSRSDSDKKLDSEKEISEFWALRGVSFDVDAGAVIGIIGRNGAGKSTLLKVLSRITAPTSGHATIRGRVASLLEVGTGFHPELSGRENIYLNGAILGMSKKEIRGKFDEIVAFAEIDKFIDTPVKRYSSGMYVRLAFAVAAHLEPEILIVDEVLAVGDAEFQRKCIGKMKEVSGVGGRTVLFVSHNMTAVQSLCTQAVLLKDGAVSFKGDVQDCIRNYLEIGGASTSRASWGPGEDQPRNQSVRLCSIQAVSKRSDGLSNELFDTQTPLNIEIEYEVLQPSNFHFSMVLATDQGETAFATGSSIAEGRTVNPEPGTYRDSCHIPANLLNAVGYTVRLLLIRNGTTADLDLNDVIRFEVRDLKKREVGSWHGREPGCVLPKIPWTCHKKSGESAYSNAHTQGPR